MASYKARQIATIKEAVAAARLAVREQGRADRLLFAETYVAHDGVQLPGRPEAEAQRQALAAELLRAVGAGIEDSADPELAHELRRVAQETDWIRHALRPEVVAFRLLLGPAAARQPACEGLFKDASGGLGPGLYGRYDIVVLRPECSDCHFVPVHEQELEW